MIRHQTHDLSLRFVVRNQWKSLDDLLPRPEEDRLFKDDLAGWSSLKFFCWDLRVLVGQVWCKKNNRFLISSLTHKKTCHCFFLLRGWFRGSKDVAFQPWIGYLLDLGSQIARRNNRPPDGDEAWEDVISSSDHWSPHLGGQDQHGHAADTQGACSQICCGESPRAFGHRVPLGDQKILTLEPTAKHMLSCGSWALVLCSSKVMPWAFERTPTERRSLFPCLPPADVGEMASQVSFDLTFWMMIPPGSFLLLRLQTIQCQSNMHASEYTMWLLLFLTSWFLKFSNLICQQLLVRFWFGRLHSICSFLGGRTSMATQRTHRELAPRYAAGKSPCLGAESATGRPEDLDSGADIEAHAELWFLGFGPLQQQSYAMSVWKNANWTGLTLSMPPSCRCWTVLTWSFGWWYHLVAFYCCGCKQSSVKATCTPASTRCDWLLFLTSWFLKFSNLICQQLLVRFWFGRLHSICSFLGGQDKHGHAADAQGACFPDMLRGKSPCLGAESATGRPEDLDSGADIEAHAELWFLGFGPLQQQSYAMSVWKNANWTGLTLSMPPSCRCWTVLTWSFGWWYHVVAFYCCGCKQSSVKATCTPASTRCWLLLFSDVLILEVQQFNHVSSCLYVSDLEGCIAFAAFWGAGQAWPRSDTQGACSQICCGKVPVPLGRECHWETRRPGLWSRHRSTCCSCGSWALVLCSSKVMPWAFERTPTAGRGSLFPWPPSLQMLDSFDLKFRMMMPCGSLLPDTVAGCKQSQCQSNMQPASSSSAI